MKLKVVIPNIKYVKSGTTLAVFYEAYCPFCNHFNSLYSFDQDVPNYEGDVCEHLFQIDFHRISFIFRGE